MSRAPNAGSLDETTLARLGDEECVETVYARVCELVADLGYDDSETLLSRLHEGARYLYATYVLDAEVCNGGFLQYFWNGHFDLDEFMVDGLRFFGANERAELAEQALTQFEESHAQLEPFLDRRTLEDFAAAAKLGIFEPLQQRYFACTEDLRALWIGAIRAHPSKFVPL